MLLRDHQGKPSTMRMACLACALTACAAVLAPVAGYGAAPDLGTLAALLGAAFGGKAWQAEIERRPPAGAAAPREPRREEP